ncbi:peroxidase family protein [Nocardioides kongjuensis]|uniref:Ca2+-binding RTX toxin-like protein n=1 Tax=Nocardioides kongjuensis TaxID=349522 RepID=A0A852RMW3_9ACTN|nr:peroxidase family protein [Nocardioides kongjuensis]NYD30626.1 Ca2+-binding RTX toxin-like protein [Nocardioides kongjuensis]
MVEPSISDPEAGSIMLLTRRHADDPLTPSSIADSGRKSARHRRPGGRFRARLRAHLRARRSPVALATALAVPLALGLQVVTPVANGDPGPVGSGFTVTTGDLAFILKQIKIAERHAATLSPAHPCSTLVNQPGDGIPDAEQVPDILTSYGLRTVDGSCNNLKAGDENFAAADQPFPRLTNPKFRPAEDVPPGFGPPGSTSYAQKKGNVFDSQPRVISNLIVDQTSTNPAAIAAAQFPVRSQGNTGVVPCTTDPDPNADPPVAGVPDGCVPSHKTLFIPNVTTDVGLSPPYNSLFTFFGQFFDHGVDQTVKSGGTVFVPLKADDPLRTLGPDGKPGTGDEVPASQAFMVLTRAQNQPGPDGVLGDDPATPADESADDVQNANNTDTPWVDQSQTYTSHASHQVFLRAYAASSRPGPYGASNPASVSTGKFLDGLPAGQTYAGSPDGTEGISTWASVKKQAAERLGLELVDMDALNVPMLATDPYGKFIPGPARGLPQYVTKTGLVEGDLANPVPVPANVLHFDTPFLTDIAHNADPSPQDTDHNPGTPPVPPVPDADDTPSADFASQQPGTYDDEMLDAHFACGDGRCNENIALSTIHQIFHSEHNRLAAEIDQVLTGDTSAAGIAALADWKAIGVSGYGYGERLFQAARFITEMQYQHLVFEEFARKVQPAIRPFHVYSPDINPAVEAEFAHAVYRFGHSMLDDDVARTNADGSDNSLPLLTAFLNPPELFDGGSAGTLGARAGAGSIIMGSSDQVGNELDEFVTETLRNNLLGLPLDLPAINMTRARDAGIPPLNDVRRQIFAETNDGQLAPYTSWSDFGQHLKHPESLINFVAAYGKHPTITGATTLAAKRAAARAIVDPQAGDVPPDDASDFMFSTGAWDSNANGVTTTGLDDVDLWVGGLAEITNLFGGLLGSTFNYVFQTQLEKLQDGDRFYYLARTPGMNLRTQLEGNSFSELIQRNTDNTNTLKADAFATADCKFQLSHLNGTSAGFAQFGSAVADDPATPDCDENLLLLRKPDGTIQYRQFNSVDPPGINGQSVYQGTDGPDRVFGGNDNDTFWGGKGRDVIEGNGGDDVALGGEGSDIITDLSGADTLKGGPGNDAADAGIGDDIMMGGDGQDVLNGGANDNEEFAGPGNDFVILGQGADAAFGDGGDDWMEGGSGQDLIQGDHGAPFFDDPAEIAPGNEIMIGQVGENDYDAEGGDDLMAANAAVDRNAGAAGFDWAFHQYDTVGADEDMAINNNLVGVPIQVVVNRDRWQEVEGNSGSAFNDAIRGTDDTPTAIGGAGFAGCDALDQAGVDRIAGLAALVPPGIMTVPASSLNANAAAGRCPLSGNVWGDGEILIGGGGSDTLTGRGANDIIDGDRSLNVRIDVHANADGTGPVIGSTHLLEHPYLTGSTRTLQQDVFAGIVDPGQLVMERAILPAPAGDRDASSSAANPAPAVDTAVFLGPRSSYTVTSEGDHLVVDQTGALGAAQKVSDGRDTLRNIEQLRFTNDDGTTETVVLAAPDAPTIGTATAGPSSADITWTPAATGQPVSSFEIQVLSGGVQQGALRTAPSTDTSAHVTGLTNGTNYTFKVRAVGAFGTSPYSAESNAVTPANTAPGAPTIGTATAGVGSASVTWSGPANNGGSPITGFVVQAINAANTVVGSTTAGPGATSATVTGLAAGTSVRLRVAAVNAVGTGPNSAPSNAVTVQADTTPPTVTARNPGINAVNVPIATTVTATFSEPVTGVSGTTVRLRNTATGTNVTASVTMTGNTVTLTPSAALANNTQYTVTLTGGATAIRDLAGNPLATTSWSFRTVPDLVAPTVTSRSPSPGQSGVAVGANTVVTFSEPVTGVTPTTFFVTNNATGTRVVATITQTPDGRTFTLNPVLNLPAGRTFTVTLTNGIRDGAGNRLVAVTWTFST